jgi:hypothetical protein
VAFANIQFFADKETLRQERNPLPHELGSASCSRSKKGAGTPFLMSILAYPTETELLTLAQGMLLMSILNQGAHQDAHDHLEMSKCKWCPISRLYQDAHEKNVA